MTERWKSVEAAPNYAVSDMGRIKNLKTGRVLRPYRTRGGYLRVDLPNRLRPYVHVLVAAAFIGPRPGGARAYDVCHNNGNPQDNRLSNLRYDTRSESVYEAHKHKYLAPELRGLDHATY